MIYVKIHDLKYCKEHFYEDLFGDFFPSQEEHERFKKINLEELMQKDFQWMHDFQAGKVLEFSCTSASDFIKIKPFIKEIYTPETHPEYYL